MQKNLILIVVALVLFMEALDTTIINTAIPAMSHSLNVYPIDLKIALISYLLSLAVFIPISGWIADKFGVKRVFITAVFIFTASSLWCGLTNNLWELVIARSIQGLGGSLTVPVGRLILLRTFGRHEFVAKMSLIVMVAALGMMLGPVLGGIITTHISWRWIFWVNIPVGITNILLSYFLLIDMPAKKVPRLDKLGFVYFGLGLATLTFGTTMLSESAVKSSIAGIIILFAILLLTAYVFHSRKKTHPIVKTQLFQLRTFQVSIIANLISRIGFSGIPFLLPLLLQISLGYSAQNSGFLIAPMAAGVLLLKPFSLPLLRRFGYKKLLIINTFCVATSIASFTLINQQTSFYWIALMTFMFGFLISLQYTGMNSLAYADVAQDDLSSATSIVSTMQQVSQSFGVAMAALLIRYYTANVAENNLLIPSAFHETFFAMSLLTFTSILIFIRLSKHDGAELVQRETKINKIIQ